MYRSVNDLKNFYNSDPGQIVRRILSRHIRSWWNDCSRDRILGVGYTQPYMEDFLGSAERCFAVSPAGRGAYSWPDQKKNLCVLAEEAELPFETNSIDKVMLIHSLENAELPYSNLQEIWRVLKSNGRLLILIPNRAAFWARSDWSPFGQGTPYSLNQLRWLLRDHLYTYERSRPVLFMPPLRMRGVLRAADQFEAVMPYILPALGGLHMVEASKQLYAGLDIPISAHVHVRGRGHLTAYPARPITTHKQASFDGMRHKS